MQTITTHTATIALVITLTACASAGTKFDMADIQAMKPGITTEQEAIAKIGKPNATRFNADGSKVVIWSWASSSPASARSGAVSVLFDKDGKFVRILGTSGVNS